MNLTSKVCLGAGAMMTLWLAGQTRLPAQDTSSPQLDTGAKKMMKSADMTFAMKAAQGGLAEVEMGKLAADKGNSADVKAFGQHMVDDHTKANENLKSVAQGENITLPATMNAKDQAEYNRLKNLSGAAFDHRYVNDMVKDHEEDVKEFQKEANGGQDAQIKNFAQQTLPTLQEHLSRIKGIQSGSSSSASKM